MKKKLAGIAALTMALTMMIGSTVSAASPDTGNVNTPPVVDDKVVTDTLTNNETIKDLGLTEKETQELAEKVTTTAVQKAATESATAAAATQTETNKTLKDDFADPKVQEALSAAGVSASVEITIAPAPAAKVVEAMAAVMAKAEENPVVKKVQEEVNKVVEKSLASGNFEDLAATNSNIATYVKSAKDSAAADGKKVTEVKVKVEVKEVAAVVDVASTEEEKKALNAVISVKGSVEIPFSVSTSLDEGETFLVMHQKTDGTWESLPVRIENGKVWAKFTSFSPASVIVAKVTTDPKLEPTGEEDDDDDDDDTADNTVNSAKPAGAAPASPKTGETMPVAGMMVVLCLGAAAICLKKVRMN